MSTEGYRRALAASAVFAPVDAFVVMRGVDGVASAAQPRGPLSFHLVATGTGAARRPQPPGWTLPVRQSASGHQLSDGRLRKPDGQDLRPLGADLDIEVAVVGPAYRESPAPVSVRLVNLDPSAPPVAPTTVSITLQPGFDYPFPLPQGRYGLVRGAVLRAARGPGIEGATVTATTRPASAWSDIYRTGPSGQFVVVVPAAQTGPISLDVGLPDGTTSSAAAVALLSTTVTVRPFIHP